jgi:hypothetical protein
LLNIEKDSKMLSKLLEWLGFSNPLPVDLRENTPIYIEILNQHYDETQNSFHDDAE